MTHLLGAAIVAVLAVLIISFVVRSFKNAAKIKNQWLEFLTQSGFDQSDPDPQMVKALQGFFPSSFVGTALSQKEGKPSPSWVVLMRDSSEGPDRPVIIFELPGKELAPFVAHAVTIDVKHFSPAVIKLLKKVSNLSRIYRELDLFPEEEQLAMNIPRFVAYGKAGVRIREVLPDGILPVLRGWAGRGLSGVAFYGRYFLAWVDPDLTVPQSMPSSSASGPQENWSYHLSAQNDIKKILGR